MAISLVQQAKDHLGQSFLGAQNGYIIVCAKMTRGLSSKAFHVSDKEGAAKYAVQMSMTTDVWFESGLQASPPSTRGREDGVCYFSSITLDYDLKGTAHKQDALPESEEDLYRLLEAAAAPSPTWVLNTGNGRLVVWTLEEPFQIHTEADRAAAKQLSVAFQGRFREVALSVFGHKLDSTADLGRLRRLPGTLNHKSAPPLPVSLVGGAGLSVPNAVAQAFADQWTGGRVAPPVRRTGGSAAQSAGDPEGGQPADFCLIEAGCAFVRDCVDNAEKLAEPEWYALASILARCKDGEKLFHEISSTDPRYDEGEAGAKLAHARKASAPRTCKSIANELSFEGCGRCTFGRCG
jgi:hypothetical protein